MVVRVVVAFALGVIVTPAVSGEATPPGPVLDVGSKGNISGSVVQQEAALAGTELPSATGADIDAADVGLMSSSAAPEAMAAAPTPQGAAEESEDLAAPEIDFAEGELSFSVVAGPAAEVMSETPRLRGSLPAEDIAAAMALSQASGGSAPSLHVPTFVWNVHWQCSLAAQGASEACKDRMAGRFVQLAKHSGAQIAAAIELSHGWSSPMSLSAAGLSGWTQVDGSCSHLLFGKPHGDAAALAFAPGWKVEKGGGGCLRHDMDTRAFAVARVVPPMPVEGCPSLCVVTLHAPHQPITRGKGLVESVCGAARVHCAVAMGDWNAPAAKVGFLWSQLIGGAPPNLATPNARTCCFPEALHQTAPWNGVYDHVATNIGSAKTAGQAIYSYQLLRENPVEEHKPVHVRLALPAAR